MMKYFSEQLLAPDSSEFTKENADLRKRLRAFVNQANENQRKLILFESLEIEIIQFDSFVNLLYLLTEKYRNVFSLDVVTIALIDTNQEIRSILNDDGVDINKLDKIIFLENNDFFASFFKNGEKPYFGQIDNKARKVLFPSSGGNPSSVALIPLVRHNKLIGSLNLRSYDISRFVYGGVSDFIEHFGAVASVCLENAVLFGQVQRSSMTDALTGIKNRRFLDEKLPIVLSNAMHSDDAISFCLLDIDRFKTVNDTYGHATGDLVLKQVAKTISSAIEPSFLFARFGGEEFAIAFTRKSLSDTKLIAESIRKKIEETNIMDSSGEPIRLTVSIGVKHISSNDIKNENSHINFIFKAADDALYRAKENGRNGVEIDNDDSCQQ